MFSCATKRQPNPQDCLPWWIGIAKDPDKIYAISMAENSNKKNAVQQAKFDAARKMARRIESKIATNLLMFLF